jgi:hypothetical protein
MSISLVSYCSPLLSRVISSAVLTPFFCSSVFETVQTSITGEESNVWEFIYEGNTRYTHWQSTSDTRLLPFPVICIPTVVYHGLHSMITHNFLSKNYNSKSFNQMKIRLINLFVADILLFPLELIIHR